MSDAASDPHEEIRPVELGNDGYVADPPNLPGHVVARQDPDDVLTHLANDLLDHALQCVREFGHFHLALSGGHTPFPLYQRLMTDPLYRGLPWARTHLWIVDERRVPFEDDLSNYKHIHEIFADHSGIPANQMHPIQATRDDADVLYEQELQEVLGWREKGHDRLDYVLLGMGPDGHTASLFPNSRALDVEDRLVTMNSGPTVVPPDRVSMTYKLLNASRMICPLVMGEEGLDDPPDRHRRRSLPRRPHQGDQPRGRRAPLVPRRRGLRGGLNGSATGGEAVLEQGRRRDRVADPLLAGVGAAAAAILDPPRSWSVVHPAGAPGAPNAPRS